MVAFMACCIICSSNNHWGIFHTEVEKENDVVKMKGLRKKENAVNWAQNYMIMSAVIFTAWEKWNSNGRNGMEMITFLKFCGYAIFYYKCKKTRVVFDWILNCYCYNYVVFMYKYNSLLRISYWPMSSKGHLRLCGIQLPNEFSKSIERKGLA